MIGAVVLAAVLVADKPWVLTWTVNWGGDRQPTTHSARFESLTTADEVAVKAPMCGPAKAPPCVLWLNVTYEAPSDAELVRRRRP